MFERDNLPKHITRLNRVDDAYLRKICYSCLKGFCKKKGRAKAAIVANALGFYICKKCLDKAKRGESDCILPVHDNALLSSQRVTINYYPSAQVRV